MCATSKLTLGLCQICYSMHCAFILPNAILTKIEIQWYFTFLFRFIQLDQGHQLKDWVLSITLNVRASVVMIYLKGECKFLPHHHHYSRHQFVHVHHCFNEWLMMRIDAFVIALPVTRSVTNSSEDWSIFQWKTGGNYPLLLFFKSSYYIYVTGALKMDVAMSHCASMVTIIKQKESVLQEKKN